MHTSTKLLHYTVDAHAVNQRIDVFLTQRDPSLTRSQIKKLISSDHVRVNHKPVKAAFRLKQGDRVELFLPPPDDSSLTPEAIPLDIIYEDEALMVINKPAGMVVHPAPGHQSGTLVHALLAHCPSLPGIGGVQRPGIVHRLDKDTSGLMVIAKSDAAHHHLSQQFKSRSVIKVYQAMVFGRMEATAGKINFEIGRHRTDRKRMSIQSREGRTAVTEWILLEQFDECALLNVHIKTGRTHQIRVHLSAIHHPILGDSVYGGRKCIARMQNAAVREALQLLSRPFLHACLLGFKHPCTGQHFEFTQSLPEELKTVLATVSEGKCLSLV